MDIADLRILDAVARLGSMNKAAAALNTVQSNVTARVRLLEAQIGVKLFDRGAKGVVPTAAGQRLLPYATRLDQLLKEALAAARDDGTPQGTLQIGTLETTAALRLPHILATYARRWPDVALVASTGTSRELTDAVLNHRLDGALVAGPVDHPDLHEVLAFHEELVLVTPPNVTGLDDLAARPELKIIVFRFGCSYRLILENLLARRGIQAVRPLEFGSLEAILGCVAAGIGVTMLPRSVASGIGHGVALHALPANVAAVDTMFIHRADRHVGSALRAFLDMLRPVQADMAAE